MYCSVSARWDDVNSVACVVSGMRSVDSIVPMNERILYIHNICRVTKCSVADIPSFVILEQSSAFAMLCADVGDRGCMWV
jgi:hypothetical protein